MPLNTPVRILLVEDSPDDVYFLRLAMEQSQLSQHLNVVEDGAAALAFLRRQPPYTEAARPHLVILDLNLPKIPGLEVLKAIRADANLAMLPVVVLTTSRSEDDLEAAYARQATAFMTKPRDLDEYDQVVQSIELFWLQSGF